MRTEFTVVGQVSTQEEVKELQFISRITVVGHRSALLGRQARILMDGGTFVLPELEIEEDKREVDKK